MLLAYPLLFTTYMKVTVFGIALIGAGIAALGGFEMGDGLPAPPEKEWNERTDALKRARIFREVRFDASQVDFTVDPNSDVIDRTLTTCRYKPEEITGTTPKFDCELPNGDKIKVKYGWTREIPSEIITTRLLHGLGFGADRVSRVATLRCFGCPMQPFHTRSLAEMLGLTGYLDRRINYDSYRDFRNVSAERNLEGEPIEIGKARGWAFFELQHIDPSLGGSTREEVDALRLMAMFIHHWDNKTANQRLICADAETASCRHPLAMIQDTGSEFGPKKVDLDNWKAQPVWSGERTQCVLSMKQMPYNGGTFDDVTISEGGRRLLGERLRQLTAKQITELFTAAGVENVPEWVSVFQDKVRQIVERPACPAVVQTAARSKKSLS
jgi:hypothetical protein